MAFHKYALDAEIVADYLPEVNPANSDEMVIVGRRNEAVSGMVDSYCNRRPGFFLPAPDTATPKQIRGENKNFLRLPVHVFGAVSVSGIAPATYYESDKNGWLYAVTPDVGSFDSNFDLCSSFWSRGRLYVVSAKWGYEETPVEIIESVKIIVGHFYGNGQGILGDVTPNGFVIQRDMPPTAKTLLQPFIKKEFEID